MRQILVAVDEHDHADQIVDSGIELAQALSAKILLVYVVPERKVPENYRDSHGDALPKHYYEDEFIRTITPHSRKIEKAGIEYEALPRTGDAEREILKAADSKKVDFIVVGTRALRRLNRLMAIGSVSRNVIEKSKVPVLAVP